MLSAIKVAFKSCYVKTTFVVVLDSQTNSNNPNEQQTNIQMGIKCLHKNLPYCIINL